MMLFLQGGLTSFRRPLLSLFRELRVRLGSDTNGRIYVPFSPLPTDDPFNAAAAAAAAATDQTAVLPPFTSG